MDPELSSNDRSFTERWDAGCDSRLLLEEADRRIAILQRANRLLSEQLASAHETTVPQTPLCDGEVRVIYEHGEPTGVRDDTGFLCHFHRVNHWSGQEDRYREELARRARQAEVVAAALRGAQKATDQSHGA